MQEIVAYFFPILLFFSILGRTNGFTNRSICWLEWPGSEVQRPWSLHHCLWGMPCTVSVPSPPTKKDPAKAAGSSG